MILIVFPTIMISLRRDVTLSLEWQLYMYIYIGFRRIYELCPLVPPQRPFPGVVSLRYAASRGVHSLNETE